CAILRIVVAPRAQPPTRACAATAGLHLLHIREYCSRGTRRPKTEHLVQASQIQRGAHVAGCEQRLRLGGEIEIVANDRNEKWLHTKAVAREKEQLVAAII